jgi:LuxR family maltose regulon positive regulatory protein
MAALLRSLIGARQRGRAAAGSGAATEHLHRVVEAFAPVREQIDKSGPAVTGLIEPLTDRELQVLRLLAAGRRNRDIAQELVVTLETVKKHVSHLFDKLGAANRTEAVAHARRARPHRLTRLPLRTHLGLLSTPSPQVPPEALAAFIGRD